jgi:hypothetical protein
MTSHLSLYFPCILFPSSLSTNILNVFLSAQFILHVLPMQSSILTLKYLQVLTLIAALTLYSVVLPGLNIKLLQVVHILYLYVPYDSLNNRRMFPCTELTGCSF